MKEKTTANDFIAKFSELTKTNQKYIIAIQQALLYAQDIEKGEKEKHCEKVS